MEPVIVLFVCSCAAIVIVASVCLQKEGPTLMYFYSDDCKFCRMYAPRIDQYALSNGGVSVEKVNVSTEEGKSAVRQVFLQLGTKIEAVPSAVFVDENGEKLSTNLPVIAPPGIMIY